MKTYPLCQTNTKKILVLRTKVLLFFTSNLYRGGRHGKKINFYTRLFNQSFELLCRITPSLQSLILTSFDEPIFDRMGNFCKKRLLFKDFFTLWMRAAAPTGHSVCVTLSPFGGWGRGACGDLTPLN